MADPIAPWLEQLGLAQYAAAFALADIDLDVLSDLTDAEFAELGVSLGHRKRMLRALAARVPAHPDQTARSERVDGSESGGEGERRQLTILFCDLVGSTALAATLDPEDIRTLVSQYHGRCAEVVVAHGGEVAQFLGDGVMAQFGFPIAHEDDAQRAVRCALAMIDAVREMNADGTTLHTRVGIATGTEVVGDAPGATRDRASIVGSTPSLASRLQNVAEVDTVVVGAATRRLLGDAFDLTSLGPREIKGAGLQEIWRVNCERHASRYASQRGEGSSPFVGRASEETLLEDRARHAREGEGQAVIVSAEPGIGKSRLVEEFLRSRPAGESVVIRFQCTPHHTASALHPLSEALETAAAMAPADSRETRREKLNAFVTSLPPYIDRTSFAEACAVLLGLPEAQQRPTMLESSADQRKAAMFRTAMESFAAVAAAASVLVVFEDVHWSDPTTLELLSAIVEDLDRQKALVILTARPEFVSPWRHHGHVSTLPLNRLRRVETEAMVVKLCGDRVLPRALIERIIERTDGVPLFVEELTKVVLDSPQTDDRFAHEVVPETLREALTARLDALASVRHVAQVASVIGREFTSDIVGEVSGLSPEALHAALQQLVESGLLIHHARTGQTGYAFKHALVRDTAYEGLLRPRRQQLHLRTARRLLASSGTLAETEPEILAHHFEEGGAQLDALPYWRRASELAISRSAYREAKLHVERALRLVEFVPVHRPLVELELTNRLGVATAVLEGPRSPMTRAIYERGSQIASGLPESRETFVASWGVCFCDFMDGNHRSAIARADELLALAERLGEDDLLIEALHARLSASFHVGEIEAVIEAASRAVELYRPEKHHAHVTTFGSGHDAGVCALGHASIALALAGRVSESRARIRECVSLMDRLKHPFTTCVGSNHIAFAFGILGAFEDCVASAAEARALADDRRFVMAEALLDLFIGNALVEMGQRQAGVALLTKVLDAPQCSAPASYQPLFHAHLALFEFEAGERSAALARLDAAESLAQKLDGAIMLPELFRVRALLLKALGDPESAKTSLERSIRLSRSFGMVLLELRASVDEVALESDAAPRAKAARARVLALVERIIDGQGTKDVVRARRMLQTN